MVDIVCFTITITITTAAAAISAAHHTVKEKVFPLFGSHGEPTSEEIRMQVLVLKPLTQTYNLTLILALAHLHKLCHLHLHWRIDLVLHVIF